MRIKKKTWKRTVHVEYDREIFDVLHMLKNSGLKDKEVCQQINERYQLAGRYSTVVTPKTIHNWRIGYANGGTRYPASFRLAAVAEMCGFERRFVPIGSNSEEGAFKRTKPAKVKVKQKAAKSSPTQEKD